jgi:hypothetical protein
VTDPTEKWHQAFRDLRARQLESGLLDLEALRSRRDERTVVATATWVRTQGSAVLAVDHAGTRAYPAFQFTDAGDLRPELAPHVAFLQDSGLSPWLIWAWLTEPVALLSGDIPEQVMVSNPHRAAIAIERYVDGHRDDG